MNANSNLSHTRWNCKHHIVFVPKCRRKVIYGKLRSEIGAIFHQLCAYKDVETMQADARYGNYLHIITLMDDYSFTFQYPVLFDPTLSIYPFSFKTLIILSMEVLPSAQTISNSVFLIFELFLISVRTLIWDALSVLSLTLSPMLLIKLNGIVTNILLMVASIGHGCQTFHGILWVGGVFALIGFCQYNVISRW